jgi:hypothetical protein
MPPQLYLQKFNACVEELRSSGQGFLVPDDRPVHGVGHSNGALLHLLIGSLYAAPNASNALISFNNKYVCHSLLADSVLTALLNNLADSHVMSSRSTSSFQSAAPWHGTLVNDQIMLI